MLVEAWCTWRDFDAALLIVERFENAFLVKHVKDLASDLDGGAGVSRLFLRVAVQRPSLLTQLRKRDGVTYAYVCARLSKSLSVRAATKLIEAYEHDRRLGILAWSLGQLGHWRLLVKLSEEVGEIENQQQESHERMGVSSGLIRALAVGNANRA